MYYSDEKDNKEEKKYDRDSFVASLRREGRPFGESNMIADDFERLMEEDD